MRVLAQTALLVALTGFATADRLARAAEPVGTVAVITDIHFNPFAVPELAPRLAGSEPKEWPTILTSVSLQGFPGRGTDTNQALLTSALAALSEKAANADLVVVSGDLLGHQFEAMAAQVLGTSPTSGVVKALASRTALYVAEALQAALPDRPILIALGNNDSECGDYQLEPGGAFLASLRDTVRELAGPDRLGQDFDRTYTAGGYYAMRHPGRAETTILVVNDVLWSTSYRDVCGGDGAQAAAAMMDWLERQLGEARAAGRRVWLVHHIPAGIDPYTTLHAATELSCPAQATLFLKEPFASRFVMLLREYATTIQAGFSGHIHQDSYRLIMDTGVAVGVEKIAPSISPIFGNNPGFHLFDYDRQTGDLMDFSTWYLTNLEQASATHPGEWRREYVFTQTFGQQAYSAAAIARIAEAMLGAGVAGERIRSTFRQLYPVSHGEIDAGTLPAYACSIGNLDLSSFIACYCDK
jgi:sphingomyelin phosphodiesterase acid-like 3